LTVRGARAITYSVVAVFAAVALMLTPPLPTVTDAGLPGGFADANGDASSAHSGMPVVVAEARIALSPAVVVPDELTVSPVIVEASTTEKLDTLAVSGVIQSNLFSALDKTAQATLSRSARAELAFSLADIFEYRVDMSKDLKVGDQFQVVVERLQKPNGSIIISKILGARLALSGNEIEAIRYTSRGASGEYFDGSGKSLRASFLRTPVTFRRISSIFGGRRHPVLGVWRRHKGTDYAAAMGTPVRSVGDGIVVFAGRKSGYGNVIDIRHRNGFVSRYGHLRSFSKGTRRGAHVAIGRTIGAVGMSGLATGPHLHFEVLVNGVQRDPRIALRMRGGEPIPSRERGVFQEVRSRTLASFATFTSAARTN